MDPLNSKIQCYSSQVSQLCRSTREYMYTEKRMELNGETKREEKKWRALSSVESNPVACRIVRVRDEHQGVVQHPLEEGRKFFRVVSIQRTLLVRFFWLVGSNGNRPRIYSTDTRSAPESFAAANAAPESIIWAVEQSIEQSIEQSRKPGIDSTKREWERVRWIERNQVCTRKKGREWRTGGLPWELRRRLSAGRACTLRGGNLSRSRPEARGSKLNRSEGAMAEVGAE